MVGALAMLQRVGIDELDLEPSGQPPRVRLRLELDGSFCSVADWLSTVPVWILDSACSVLGIAELDGNNGTLLSIFWNEGLDNGGAEVAAH